VRALASAIDVQGLGRAIDRPDWRGQRIAVLGDIHGNRHAFDAALDAIAAAGIRAVCCHGDLLTYGCSPNGVLDGVDRMLDAFDAVLLSGNHEPFYFGGQRGDDASFGSKRPFISESVRWTLAQIPHRTLAEDYDWHEVCTIGNVLITHANPYMERTWRYVNQPIDELDAAIALIERRARVGVFGHTHRARLTAVHRGTVDRRSLLRPVDLQEDGPSGPRWVLNTGSVGQPRGQGATWLELDLAAHRAQLHRIRYDVSAHLRTIETSGMSSETIERLLGFFGPTA
jgi:predicted phosphodiesterase